MDKLPIGFEMVLGQIGISRGAARAGSEIAEQAGEGGMQVFLVVGGVILLIIVFAVAIKMRRD